MAKKSKRRPWSTADVRTLKTAAKRKARAASIALQQQTATADVLKVISRSRQANTAS
jgi:hypothetical protein